MQITMKDDFILTLYQKPQTVFSLKELSFLAPKLPYDNLKSRMSYYVKSGKILKIRRGIFAKKNYNILEIPNKIYTPSYISLETVLQRAGIIFQNYSSIFAVSYLTRTILVAKNKLIYRSMKKDILLNKNGITEENGYFIASAERAFLDGVFLYKNYHFDNLKRIDWDKIWPLVTIYANDSFEKRIKDYYQTYKEEYG